MSGVRCHMSHNLFLFFYFVLTFYLFIVAYEKYVSVILRAARTLLKRYRIFSKVTVVLWSQIIKNMAVFGIYS